MLALKVVKGGTCLVVNVVVHAVQCRRGTRRGTSRSTSRASGSKSTGLRAWSGGCIPVAWAVLEFNVVKGGTCFVVNVVVNVVPCRRGTRFGTRRSTSRANSRKSAGLRAWSGVCIPVA